MKLNCASWIGSPNFGYPRGAHGQTKSRLVIKVFHITGPGTLAGMDTWFNNPNSGASAHFGLHERVIHQYVDTDDAAWHAGLIQAYDPTSPHIAGFANSGVNPNLCSIGIEVVSKPGDVLTQTTWNSLIRLCKEIDAVHEVQLDFSVFGHVGHNQIDGVNRKQDPISVYSPVDVYEDHHGEDEMTDAERAKLNEAYNQAKFANAVNVVQRDQLTTLNNRATMLEALVKILWANQSELPTASSEFEELEAEHLAFRQALIDFEERFAAISEAAGGTNG